MKYYIDFEATQYSLQIIEIGCISETGREFSSLVKPYEMSGVTNYIQELTGINKKELYSAPSADTVFSRFRRWLENDAGNDADIIFCTYGDCDGMMAKRTAAHCNNQEAYNALMLLSDNIYDAAFDIKNKIGKNGQAVTLHKVFETLELDDSSLHMHRALDDAITLKMVCEHSEIEPILTWTRIKDRKKKKKPQEYNPFQDPNWFGKRRFIITHGSETQSFNSIEKALQWCYTKAPSIPRDGAHVKNLKNGIRRAVINKHPYFGYTWTAKKKRYYRKKNTT